MQKCKDADQLTMARLTLPLCPIGLPQLLVQISELSLVAPPGQKSQTVNLSTNLQPLLLPPNLPDLSMSCVSPIQHHTFNH